MDMNTLSTLQFGDKEGLQAFLFENYQQHELFREYLFNQGVNSPAYPIADVDVDDFDDWLMMHQQEHQFFAAQLNLANPFNMLDADFRKEDDFYEWLAQHYLNHVEIAAKLGISS
jgi:hypothetical protein